MINIQLFLISNISLVLQSLHQHHAPSPQPQHLQSHQVGFHRLFQPWVPDHLLIVIANQLTQHLLTQETSSATSFVVGAKYIMHVC